MKSSTPDHPKPPEPLSILLIGPPGGGKSTLAIQFPKVWIANCDENLDGPVSLMKKGYVFAGKQMFAPRAGFSFFYDNIRRDDKDQPVDVALCYDRLMEKLTAVKSEAEVRTAFVDNLTHVNEFVIRKILKLQNRNEMEARDWIPFKSDFYRLLVSKIRDLGKNTICAVHESKDWAPDPKNIINKILLSYSPSVQGSIVDYFGSFFTDIWRCEARPAPGGRLEFWVVTQRTHLSDLKNSCQMPNEINVTQGADRPHGDKPSLFSYLEGRL